MEDGLYGCRVGGAHTYSARKLTQRPFVTLAQPVGKCDARASGEARKFVEARLTRFLGRDVCVGGNHIDLSESRALARCNVCSYFQSGFGTASII